MKQIPLTQGKVALVDDSDYEMVSRYKWSTSFQGRLAYAVRMTGTLKQTKHFMHREIIDAPKGMIVDHIDHDGLNNQRHNLRLCTNTENVQHSRESKNNLTGYKGVSWSAVMHKWRARIMVNRHEITLGYFDIPVDAAIAYNKAALKYFGAFAYLNKIP